MNTAYIVVVLLAIAAFAATYVIVGEPYKKPLQRARMSLQSQKKKQALEKKRASKTFSEGIDQIGETFERILPLKLSEARDIQDKLDLAGLKITPTTWRAISLLATIGGGALLLFAGLVGGRGVLISALCCVIGAVAGWALCGIWLSNAGKQRGKEIDRYLPTALELLTISVSAGVLVERGFRQLAENKSLGAISEEFARTDVEISHLGVSRVEALNHMRKRCDSPLMGYFCSALIEATEKGTSIAGVLESQAKLARKARYDALTREINALSTKMAIPLVLFMIACLVLVLAPLVPSVVELITEISF